MSIRRNASLLLGFLLILSLLSDSSINAEDGNGATAVDPSLFQKMLNLHEIRKEVERVTKEEERLKQTLAELATTIRTQEERTSNLRTEAGRIAKAYYMGDHLDLLFLLLQSRSLGDAIMKYEYISAIFTHQEKVLRSFDEEAKRLQTLLDDQRKKIALMEETRLHLMAEERLLTELEKELTADLMNLPDAEKMRLLLEGFIRDWEENGLPTFERFLDEISKQTRLMPAAFKDQVQLSLTGASLTITDEAFTQYLRDASPLFRLFTVHFHENNLTFFGEYEGRTLTLSGHYEMGTNVLYFHIDQLIYNGYTLPEETVRTLDKRYDLGLYIDQIRAGVKLKEALLSEGEMTLRFSLSF